MEDKIGRTFEQLLDERTILIDDTKTFQFIPSYSQESNKELNVPFSRDAVRGNFEKSLLSTVFFSKANIQKLQNKIRYTIYKMSKDQFIIEEQSEAELKIIMRSIYLQYSKNLKTKIKEQVNELNEILVSNIAEKLFSNVRQYIQYLKDAQSSYGGNPYVERPVSLSSAGTKQLELGSVLGFGNIPYKEFN